MARGITQAETRELVKQALDLGAPQSFTIGEVKSAVENAAGHAIGRTAIENALKELKAAGLALVEYRECVRNGFPVKNARHFYAPRPKPEAGDDPFDGLSDEERLIQKSFKQAYEKVGKK